MHKRAVFLLLMWLLISITLLAILFYAAPVSAGTLRVPQDYSTIQAAIDAAQKSDIIEVSPDVYYENVVVNKEITLRGENKDTTIIDGQQGGNVIHVQTSGVTIIGFTIRNGNNGIRVMSTIDSINVTGNIIKNNNYGISLLGDDVASTTDNIIVGNTFVNNSKVGISIKLGLTNNISQNNISESAWGVKLSLTNATTISDNLLESNSYGIYMSYCTSNNVVDNIGIDNSYCIYAAYSDNILVRGNSVNGSTYGIELYGSHGNTILYNDVSDNPSYSIYLVYSDLNSVTNNTVSQNDWGLTLYDCSSNTFEGNTISYNTFGITNSFSPGNTFYHNNFIDNVDQVMQDVGSTNTWSQSGEGNYWSDYQGVDDGSGGRVAGDGIGDTLIPHLGLDYYPLMHLWPAKPNIAILGIYESTNVAYVGQIVSFEVIVGNEGPLPETFNVTLQNNVTIIEKRNVTSLAPYTNTTLIFNWNTSTVLPGYYLISVFADPVPDEVDLTDNSMTDGTINIKILLGDINNDSVVDNNDLVLFSQAYGSKPGDLNWNSEADINEDNLVDARDLYLLGKCFGKTM